MSRTIFPRVNFFDGQQVTETDLDTEQAAWHGSLANGIDFLAGSGVEQAFASQRVLFDSDDVPGSVQDLIDDLSFDGEPVYETDSFGTVVFEQPSDSAFGTQLEVRVTSASLLGSFNLKVYIFGLIYDDVFVQEVLTFDRNESQFTRNYFTNIVAFMTQDFAGNQNTIIDGYGCRDSGGRVEILEAAPLMVVRDPIMAHQTSEPNMDYVNFKPAVMSKTLDTVLGEIADSEDLSVDDLEINVTSTSTRELPPNINGLIVAQKFKATTNNIQKVSLLFSVQRNSLALTGHEYDWSGNIVVGIRKLQTTTNCPTDITPNTTIEYEPEPSALAEMSFDQSDLEDRGIILGGTAQEVDFLFTSSLISNPSVEPNIEVGSYYAITISRSGDISEGTIILQEAANTDAGTDDTDEMRLSVFSQNIWIDVPESDLWFKVYTNAVRLVNGTAYDDGVQITVPNVKENTSTGTDEPYIEGNHSLIDVSQSSDNYVIIQKTNEFDTPVTHPSTGNLINSRIQDSVDVAVVDESTLAALIEAGNNTIVLGSVRDVNLTDTTSITGTTSFPGLVTSNTFTIIQPDSDIILNNLVGSILTPNTNKANLKYRIIEQEIFDDAYGDINLDGVVDTYDVVRAQVLDGYSKDLQSGSLSSFHQRQAIIAGTVTMEEIIRADVNVDGTVDIYDSSAIQQNISLGTSFDAGSSFKRVVLTVEDLFDPLTDTPDMIGEDSSFNDVPFSPIEFSIDWRVWKPENISITDLRRFVPKTFTSITSSDITGTTKSGGTNSTFVPGNLILGGQILETDSTYYPVDLEVATVVLELPEGSTQGEIDIFNNFIRNQMKFADGTYVGGSALSDNQVVVTASIQSLVKDTDGYDFSSNDGYEAVEETVAVLYTQSSGVLRVRAANIRNIVTRPELRTKIVLTVYLKRAGFQNTEEVVEEARVTALLNPV